MDTATKEKVRGTDVMAVDQQRAHLYYPVNYRMNTSYYPFSKRVLDVLISSILILTVLSWVYPLLFILINITSRGGVLFIQKRIGLNGKEFKCFKFRTMVVNDESDRMETALNDKRITPLGKWLRLTYIDELPQLVNVLIGDMSIVGPRPHMLYHHRKFCREIPFYDCRHWVKPGITGLAQVKGYHGWITDRSHIGGRTRLDLFYVQKVSLKLDMMILAKTISILFSFNKNMKR